MDASIWCDPCEGYPSVYVKLKKADVSPVVHGRWKYEETLGVVSLNGYECSECGQNNGRATNYCPNCGARMDGKSCVPREDGDGNG